MAAASSTVMLRPSTLPTMEEVDVIAGTCSAGAFAQDVLADDDAASLEPVRRVYLRMVRPSSAAILARFSRCCSSGVRVMVSDSG